MSYSFNHTSSVWETGREEFFDYDANDNLLSHFIRYDLGNNIIEDGSLYLFEYNSNNQLITFTRLFPDQMAVLDTFEKSTFTYGTGIIPETEVIYRHIGSGWEEDYKFQYFHNNTDGLDSMIGQYHNGNAFENEISITYQRNSFNQIETIDFMRTYNQSNNSWEYADGDVLISYYYDIDTTNSIKKVNNILNVNVYPNPASNQIKINTGNEKVNAVNIYDNMGRLIKQQRINQSQKEIIVSISNLNNGTYTVQIIGEQKQGNCQIVIVR